MVVEPVEEANGDVEDGTGELEEEAQLLVGVGLLLGALDAAQNGGRNGESDQQLLRKVRNCLRAAACEYRNGRLGL